MESGAIVLLSGGIDSTAALAIAKQRYTDDKIITLSIDYGQIHSKELECAKWQADFFKVQHELFKLDFPFNSPITDPDQTIPETLSDSTKTETIVPGKNIILIGLASSFAESMGFSDVWIGVSASMFGSYPDCRHNFMGSMQNTLTYGTSGKIVIKSIFLDSSKADIIKKGTLLGVDWSHTWSCLRNGDNACGRCPACQIRLETFAQLSMIDPLTYDSTVVQPPVQEAPLAMENVSVSAALSSAIPPDHQMVTNPYGVVRTGGVVNIYSDPAINSDTGTGTEGV